MKVFLIERHDIITSDGFDSRVFGVASIGIVRPVHDLIEFSIGDLADIVVSSRDTGAVLHFCQVNFILLKTRCFLIE